jgi:ADP-heptose:LPS heptosyltransferase
MPQLRRVFRHLLRSKNMSTLPLLQRIEVESVAVFRALQLGDMLCSVPALRALRAALPGARIALIGLPSAQQFAERFSKYVDVFFAFPGHAALPEQPVQEDQLAAFYATMQSQGFTLSVQLHGSGEVSNDVARRFRARASAGYTPPGTAACDQLCYFPYPDGGAEPLRLLKLVALLGAQPMGAQLEFPLTAQDWAELERSGLGAGLVPGSYACIHPGARQRDKCWPAQRFAEVADRLALEFGLRIVLTGSASEIDLANAVADHMKTPAMNAAAPISVGAMAALMSRARLLVCNDTGVSHIAAALRLKSVVIFSKADIRRWAPLDQQLHRCLWDPDGAHASAVLAQARQLLAAA